MCDIIGDRHALQGTFSNFEVSMTLFFYWVRVCYFHVSVWYCLYFKWWFIVNPSYFCFQEYARLYFDLKRILCNIICDKHVTQDTVILRYYYIVILWYYYTITLRYCYIVYDTWNQENDRLEKLKQKSYTYKNKNYIG